MTDNRTTEPTEAQVEAACVAYESTNAFGPEREARMRAALVAAQEAAPARLVIDREAVAREVYRELYPGTIGTHDSKRTAESDLRESDRAYATWDGGNEGFAPGIICRRIADRVLAAGFSRAAQGAAPVLPSSGVDEEALAQVIYDRLNPSFQQGEKWLETVDGTGNRQSWWAARAVAEWLKGQGGGSRGER